MPKDFGLQGNHIKKADFREIDSLIHRGRDLAFIDKSKSAGLAAQALILSLENGYEKGQADAYRLNSVVTFLSKDYLLSLEYLESSIAIYKKLGDLDGLGDTDISYGYIFRDLNQHEKSEFHFRKAYEYFSQHKSSGRFLVASYNFANILFENGKVEKAKSILLSLSELESIDHDLSFYTFFLNLKGKIDLALGDYENSKNHLKTSQKISLSLEEQRNKTAYIESLFYLGKVYFIQHQYDSAGYYFDLAKQDPYLYLIEDFSDSVFNGLIKLRIVSKNVANLNEDIENYFKFKDQNRLNSVMINSEFKFDFLNKQFLVEENLNLKEQESINRFLNTIYLGLIFIISFFFFLFFYNKRKKDFLSRTLDIQKQRFSDLFENCPIPIFVIDQHGEVLVENQRFNDFSRLSGNHIVQKIISNVLNYSCNDSLGESCEDHFLEFELDEKFLKVYFVKDNNPGLYEFTILIEDYTDLKKSITENSNLHELLNQSYDVANIGTYSIHMDSNLKFSFLDYSKNTFSILARSGDKATEYQLLELFNLSTSTDFLNILEEFSDLDQYFDRTYELLNDAKVPIKWVRVIGKVKKESKDSFFISGILQDVSLEKKLLVSLQENLIKEKELNLVKTKFLSMTSHEFRTPVSVASSSIEMIDMYLEASDYTETTRKITKHTHKIATQLNKILVLLDDILILERTSLADKSLNFQTVFLDEYLENLISEYNGSQDGRSIVLNLKGSGFEFSSDLTLLEFLFNNLISNALKFSLGKSDPHVVLIWNQFERSFTIRDFGIGIPEAELPFIFNSFYRASNSSSVKGSGLGLAIVQEICKTLNYTIGIDSKLNEGTSIKISFPF